MFDAKVIKIKGILKKYNLEDKAVFYEDISKLTSIKAGGRCICFLKINQRKILKPLLEEFLNKNIKFYPLGEGTNVLFADGLINIVLLKLGCDYNYIDIKNSSEIALGAAYNLQKFVVKAAKAHMDFSFLAGIPGTIGGAVIGSSGTKKENINEYVKKIRYISVSGKMVEEKEKKLSKKNYGYRFFKASDLAILTDIFLGGHILDSNPIFEKIRENIKLKKISQTVKSNNSGCFFKNQEKVNLSAGEMIDKCGFKGFRYGGARVSHIHSNFIENFLDASAKDIFILSKIIKDCIKEKFKVDMEYEVKLVGFK